MEGYGKGFLLVIRIWVPSDPWPLPVTYRVTYQSTYGHPVPTANVRQHQSPTCPLPSCLTQAQEQPLLLYLKQELVQVHPLKMLEIKPLLKYFAEFR